MRRERDISVITSEPRREAEQGRHLREMLRVLHAHRHAVLSFTLGAAVLAGAHLALRTTRYTADAVIALEPRKVQVLPLDTVVSRLPQESPVLRTELDVISSRSMAESVLREAAGGTADEARLRGEVDRLLDGLRVSNDGRSFTIIVSYTDPDPERAARIANAFAEGYLRRTTTAQTQATRDAGEWLGKRLESLRLRLEASENKVQNFRISAGLVEVSGVPVEEQRLTSVSTELAAARSARAAAEARLAAVDERGGLDAPAEGGASEFFDTPALQGLRRDLIESERALFEIEQGGAMKSPDIPGLRTRMASIRRQLAAEAERIRTALASELEVARRKEADLAGAVAGAEAALARVKAARVQLDQLEREARADRTLYESFLNRYKQTLEQEGLTAPEARIISRAETPRVPSSRRLPLLVLALGAGFGSGIGFAFLREALDRRVRSVRRLEAETGIAVIADLPEPAKPGRAVQLLPLSEPFSAYSEAVRRLGSVLDCPRGAAVGRVVAVTSAAGQDGKTALTVSLARSLAAAGRRVVAVEAHAAAPQLGAAFGAVPSTDLESVVRDRVPVETLLTDDPRSDVAILAAALGGRNPPVYVDTDGFARVIGALKQQFDVVLLDAPALAEGSEALSAARSADEVLVVARWKRTGGDAVASGIRRLALAGIAPTGIVLTGCDDDVDTPALPAPARLHAGGHETGPRLPLRRRPALAVAAAPAAMRGAYAEGAE